VGYSHQLKIKLCFLSDRVSLMGCRMLGKSGTKKRHWQGAIAFSTTSFPTIQRNPCTRWVWSKPVGYRLRLTRRHGDTGTRGKQELTASPRLPSPRLFLSTPTTFERTRTRSARLTRRTSPNFPPTLDLIPGYKVYHEDNRNKYPT
jgi:hypothetical protein